MTENNLSDFLVNPDNFRIIDQLGQGGYGSVFLVEEISTGNQYAAKIMKKMKDRSQEKKLIRECEILVNTKYPAIISLHGISLTGFSDFKNKPVIFTKYMVNKSLDDRIYMSKEDPTMILTNTQKQIILYGIAKGMQYLHSKKIIHRDLKPANILLDENLYPKICDFGLSKITPNIFLRKQSVTCGTSGYMAPEVFNGSYDFHCDSYSFGIIVFELINNNFIETFASISDRVSFNQNIFNLKRPPGMPERFYELFLECIQEEAIKRPQFSDISQRLLNYHLPSLNLDEFMIYVNSLNNYFIPQQMEIQDSDSSGNEADYNYEKAKEFQEGPNKNPIKAANYMGKAARAGNTNAQYEYGLMLKEAQGVVQDITQAYEFIKLAADDNHVNAQLAYAKMLSRNNELSEATKYMKVAADNSCAEAQYYFSNMLKNGLGIQKNESESIKYLEKAANNNYPEAQYKYGKYLLKNNNTKQAENYLKLAADQKFTKAEYAYGVLLYSRKEKASDNESAKYFQSAADKGDPKAQCALGMCFKSGRGIKKNSVEAFKYFKDSSDQNYPEGIYYYALELEKKKSKKQRAEAKELFKKAADMKFPLAAEHYAQIMESIDEISEAAKYYQIAADDGIASSQYHFANMLLDGNGVANDKKKAIKYLKKAAEQNNLDAIFLYAQIQEQARNWKEAAKSYKAAADSGNIEAIEKYILILEKEIHNPKKFDEMKKYMKLGSDKGSELCKIQYAKIMNDKESMKQLAETNDDAKYEYAMMIKDNDEALNYLNEAANKMHVPSILKLAEIYKFGKNGVKRDLSKSNSYYRQAADDLNNTEAQVCMGKIYYSGANCKRDPVLAKKYFKKAALNGDPGGQLNYGLMLLNDPQKSKPEKAAFFLKQAADQKNPPAQYHIALLLMSGRGIEPNSEEAEKYLKQSADENYPNAVIQYAFYQKDRKHNIKEAIKYFTLAARNDNSDASVELYKLLHNSGNEKEEKKAMKYLEDAIKKQNKEAIEIYNKIHSIPNAINLGMTKISPFEKE